MSYLILVRHGQSIWNLEKKFTGWVDVDLTENGKLEAKKAGELINTKNINIDIYYSSFQLRAKNTLELIKQTLQDTKVSKEAWQLNERHYGDLTGKNKDAVRKEFGDDQLHAWRRGYNTPPPPISQENPFNPNNDPQYAGLTDIPLTECLADVVARLVPYWETDIFPSLGGEKTVLVVAHGNSLRALCKYLDSISEDEIPDLNIPTGIPLVYELDKTGKPIKTLPVLHRLLS